MKPNRLRRRITHSMRSETSPSHLLIGAMLAITILYATTMI